MKLRRKATARRPEAKRRSRAIFPSAQPHQGPARSPGSSRSATVKALAGDLGVDRLDNPGALAFNALVPSRIIRVPFPSLAEGGNPQSG